jgi:hypothetical protein
MGIKQSDLVTPLANGPSPITPVQKAQQLKAFQVLRTDTSTTLKEMEPADASIYLVLFHGSVASDAGTSSVLTITIANNSGTISTGTVDLKANGATTAIVQMTNLPNIEPLPLLGDLRISAAVAETGTASTVGGPWKVSVQSVR